MCAFFVFFYLPNDMKAGVEDCTPLGMSDTRFNEEANRTTALREMVALMVLFVVQACLFGVLFGFPLCSFRSSLSV